MKSFLSAMLRLLATLSASFTPWVLCAIRLWLGQSFLMLHVAMAMHGQSLASAFRLAAWTRIAELVAASGPGAVVAAAAPVLLAAGLAARPAACALLLQVWLLRAPGQSPALDALWSGLLLAILVLGPGRLSLDALLGPGLGRAPLPGALLPARAYRALGCMAPPYLLLLRGAVALMVFAPHAAPGGGMQAMAAAHLPPAPPTVAGLPQEAAALAAILLALGFGVRPVALALLVLAAGDPAPMTGFSVALLLLLALLATRGGGALALDRALAAWLGHRLRRPADASLPHVVIVGGGFGGIAAAQGLARAPCRITLVDRRNHQVFQPLLYQVATAELSPADIATPIRAMFRHQDNLAVLLGEVTGIDAASRVVHIAGGRLDYDMLVLATGARHSYFGHDAWAALAPGLKSLEDALAIRARLLGAFEAAEREPDPAARQAWLTFVVIGAGPTGVELAGAIAELARYGLSGEFRAIDLARARVVLVQSGARVLPAFPPSLSAAALAALARLGVEVRLDAAAEAIDEAGVRVGGVFVAARTVLWAAGVMASPAAAWLGAPADRAGRVTVSADLTVPGHPEIFAVGDTASSMAWSGQPVPGLAPAAKQGGAYAARVIRARLRGRRPPGPFRYHHAGSLATIGRQAAVADFGRLRLRGGLAWWLWGGVHIFFLVGGRNRIGVMLEWLWAYLTFRRGSRLITGVPFSVAPDM